MTRRKPRSYDHKASYSTQTIILHITILWNYSTQKKGNNQELYRYSLQTCHSKPNYQKNYLQTSSVQQCSAINFNQAHLNSSSDFLLFGDYIFLNQKIQLLFTVLHICKHQIRSAPNKTIFIRSLLPILSYAALKTPYTELRTAKNWAWSHVISFVATSTFQAYSCMLNLHSHHLRGEKVEGKVDQHKSHSGNKGRRVIISNEVITWLWRMVEGKEVQPVFSLVIFMFTF
jgi:hypothetical protein